MNGITYNPPLKITEFIPSCPEEVAYSTEVLRCGQVNLPSPKPDIETIINVRHKFYLSQVSIIPVKLDPCSASGCKFLLRGFIRLEVEYSALCPEQTVHLVHAAFPFETLIIGKSSRPIPAIDCDINSFNIYGHLEYVSSDIVDCRNIEFDIVLLLWLKRKQIDCQDVGHTGYLFEDCSESNCHDCSHKFPSLLKQITVNEKHILPSSWPSITEILDCSVKVNLHKVELIKTPLVIGPCCLPLKKVIIKGYAEAMVKYLTDKASQDIHAFTFNLKICSLIEWPGGPPVNAPLCVQANPEYFTTEKISPRSVFSFLILLFEIS